MSYIPKYIIKRMFKKDECLSVVKYEGEDWVKLQMLNVISPIEVPEGNIDLGGENLPDGIGDMIKISVNGLDVPATKDMLLNDVSLWAGGDKFTWKTIFEDHAAGGKIIPVGGKLSLLLRKSKFPQNVQDLMVDGADAEVKVEANIGGSTTITAKAVLKVGADFDPSST
jgi:hypothetical protein